MAWRAVLAVLAVGFVQNTYGDEEVSRNFEVIPLQGYNVPLYHFPVVMTGYLNTGTPPQPLRVALLTTYPITELNCTKGNEKNYQQERSSTARNVTYVKGCVAMKNSNACGYVVPSSTGEIITVYLSDLSPSRADYDRYAVEMQFACKDKGFPLLHPQHKTNLFADLHGVVGLRSVDRPTKQFPKSYLDTLFEQKHISHNMFSMCFSTIQNSTGTFGIGRMILGGFASEHHSQPLRYTPMFRTHQTHVYTAKLVAISLEHAAGGEAIMDNTTLPAVLASGDPVSYLPPKLVAKLVEQLRRCKPQGCFAEEDLNIEHGTVCYTSPVVDKFPALQLSFQGVRTLMNATDYLYPVNHAKPVRCLNFLPWKKVGNRPTPEVALLGIRFFQNRDIVFDTDLSVIGFADANCAANPHVPDEHGGYNAIHLKDGEPVLSASTNGTYKYFNYVVKPGASTSSSNLVVALTALDGDPDLYVSWNKYNMPPTRTHGKYDIKSSWRETLEYVLVPAEHLTSDKEVTISIGIFAYHSDVKFSVVAFREGESAVSLLDGLPMFGSVKKDKPMHFLFSSPRAKDHSVEFTLIADTGSPDLYATGNTNHLTLDVAEGMQWPTASSSEFKSTSPGTADDYIIVKQKHYESYLLSVVAPGNATFHITATSTSTTTMLKDGKPQKFHVGFGKYRYFSFFASKPNTAVSIDLTNEGSGDPDLYVSCFIEPTGTDDGTPSRLTNHYNWSSTRTGADSVFIGSNETCAGKGQASMFYIAVKGFRSADFSIVVSTLDGPLVKLRDSKPQQSFVLSSQYKFFQFTLPKDNVNTTLITRAADAGALEIYVTTKPVLLQDRANVDDPCKCSPFGARGVLGLAPGCGKHPWPEAVGAPYCYVDKPTLCFKPEVKDAVAALRSTRKNKVKQCDLKHVSSQLPIGENENSFQFHGDGSTGLTVLPDQSVSGPKVITIGVRATVSTSFQITATTSANLPIPLANGAMSAQHFIKDGVELFEFNYVEASKPFIVMITAEHGKAKWYLAKKTTVADGRNGADAWLNMTTPVVTFNPHQASVALPCAARQGVKPTPLCNGNDFFNAGSFIIGVEKDGEEDLLFSVTVTMMDTETSLKSGRRQYKLTEQHGDASSEYIAKFVSKSHWASQLEVSTERQPAISATYCNLDVFIYSCVDNCKPATFFQNRADPQVANDMKSFSVEPKKTGLFNLSTATRTSTHAGSNYILVVAHKTATCEARVPFTILATNSNSMVMVDESCFARSGDGNTCHLVFDRTTITPYSLQSRRHAKIRYYMPQDVYVEVEGCEGSLTVTSEEMRFGRSNARTYMRIGGLQGLERLHTGYDPDAVNILYVSVHAWNSASFIVNIYKNGINRLREVHSSVTVTVLDLRSVRVNWFKPGHGYGHPESTTDKYLYDVYWWRNPSGSALSSSYVISTQCGLKALPDVQVAEDIDGESHTISNLEPGGSYYFAVVAKCAPGTCSAAEITYTPRFQVMVQASGWMVVGFVVLSALALSLLIPAVVYARRMYKEKQVLKRQLEYEMCDVRNVIALDTERSVTNNSTEESNLLGNETEYQLNQI